MKGAPLNTINSQQNQRNNNKKAKEILAFYYYYKCGITEYKNYNMCTQMATFITNNCKTEL